MAAFHALQAMQVQRQPRLRLMIAPYAILDIMRLKDQLLVSNAIEDITVQITEQEVVLLVLWEHIV